MFMCVYLQAIGTVATAVMTYMMIRKDEEVMVWDRAYRLRHHKSQSHLDKVTYGVVGEWIVFKNRDSSLISNNLTAHVHDNTLMLLIIPYSLIHVHV